ncbi:MAG: hypothetical protein K8R39_00410 [Arcobacteraceae bacterium]|nr:hypothetical protein [Arcobacteraceae bacterium]
MKTINICFEYLLKKDGIYYFDELINRDKFNDMRPKIDYLTRNWFIKDGNDYTIYKNISIGKVISYELFNSNINTISFIMMVLSVNPSHINIYKSTSINIDSIYFEILEKMNISYKLIVLNESVEQELSNINESSHENFFKNFLRKIIISTNNLLKNRKQQQKCFYQGYFNTIKLMEKFDNKIVTDQLPVNLKKIFSISNPLYFMPKLSKVNRINYSLNIDKNSDLNTIVSEICKKHYKYVKNEVKYVIDTVIKYSKKYNITKAILIHPEGRIPSIFKQYLNNIEGEVALYNHGVIIYTHQIKELDNINTVLTWSNFETSFYKSIDLNVIPAGYPSFIEIQKYKEDIVIKKDLKEQKILILPFVPDERYDFSRGQIIEINKNLINMLLELGFKKENLKFKIHPGRANKFFYTKVYQNELLSKNIIKEENLVDLINKVDFVIGPASTVIYEASFLSKPYYTYEPEPDILRENEISIFHEEYVNAVATLEGLKFNLLNKKSQNVEYFNNNALYHNNYNEIKDIIYSKFLKV